ncbi:MAG: efflux RND transporter periplasmic adaptor subunit, partial [Bacteroidales bacterium]|nr:efflux RND transporter periplasmic adaptor subunit [Bacteroidales bacterium]
MKKGIIVTGSIIGAFLLLFVFNKVTSKDSNEGLFTEVKTGEFEIAFTNAGELIAEKSVDINGPDYFTGRDIRSTSVRITDLIPEGTMVEPGDYVGQLDRTELNNMLKDERERLATMRNNLEMKILDTAVQLNDLRDDLKNQRFTVEEAAITLRNSKFEPPTVIRQAEISLDKAQRVLEQKERNYTRRQAQMKTDIYNQTYWYNRIAKRVSDLEEVMQAFTIRAPASGMVIYKKDFRGTKRKIGSMVNPIDRVIATLPDLSSLISRTFVSEIEVSRIKPGQKAEITIDALPDKFFTGVVTFVANIGEKLPNTADKVFEVQVRLDKTDPVLRPSMTTGNKIIISTVPEAVFVPTESVHAGTDSIPFVYTRSGNRQVVVLGPANEKDVIIEKGLKPGTQIYLDNPEDETDFRLRGEELIPEI